MPNFMRSACAVATAMLCWLLPVAAAAETPDEEPQPRIIDAHFHAMDCTPGGLDRAAQWMTEFGVARIIVHPLAKSLPRNDDERQQMLGHYQRYKGKMNRFCIFTPDEVSTVEEAIAKLEKEKADGAIGFGEHYGRGLFFDDPANLRLYEACARVGLPVMFHMDGFQNKDKPGFPHLEAALKGNPDCTFIAHGPNWWKPFGNGDCDRLLKAYPNLYADLSAGSGARAMGRNKAYTRDFMIRHADKLLFGTDCGWWSFKANAKPAPQFQLVKDLDLPIAVQRKVYHGNAIRILKLK